MTLSLHNYRKEIVFEAEVVLMLHLKEMTDKTGENMKLKGKMRDSIDSALKHGPGV